MKNGKGRDNKLTKKEQATNVAYKLMSEKINSLEKSLKKTQDESEKERQAKNELEKKIILLESNLENNIYIEIFKFLSSGGIGFAINYVTGGFWQLGLSIGIPSIIVFIVCIVVSKK